MSDKTAVLHHQQQLQELAARERAGLSEEDAEAAAAGLRAQQKRRAAAARRVERAAREAQAREGGGEKAKAPRKTVSEGDPADEANAAPADVAFGADTAEVTVHVRGQMWDRLMVTGEAGRRPLRQKI